MKKIFIAVLCTVSFSCFASNANQSTLPDNKTLMTLSCPHASPTTDPNFCSTFATAAICGCLATGIPSAFCKDPKSIYSRMISVFGSLQRACEYQHDTSTQDCVNGWSCYINGGRDSNGGLCSASGRACE